MSRSIMRHVSDGLLHVVPSRTGYAAPDWVYVRDLATGEDPSFLIWQGGQAIVSVVAVERMLLDQIDAERERRQMLILTSGGAKKMVYSAKQSEVEAYYSLAGTTAAITTAFNLLATDTKARRYRYAMREAAMTGQTVAVVMARFKAGADAAQDEAARIEAIAQKAKLAIKAAATAAAKQAAFAAINWSAT